MLKIIFKLLICNMLETIIQYLQNIPSLYLLATVFFFAFIENIFPPSPSDAVILFAGTLIPLGNVNFFALWVFATLGSVVGFLTMFAIGVSFDRKVVETGKIKFIKYEHILKVERWFQKWGYWLIVINRFLSGTRAVISFFAGMSLLKVRKTTLLCAISAGLWNFILIYLGYTFSQNWQEIYDELENYGYYFLAAITLIAIGVWIYNRKIQKN